MKRVPILACFLIITIMQARADEGDPPGSCASGDACYWAALKLLRKGEEVSSKKVSDLFRKAAGHYAEACKAGNANACDEHGTMYIQGRGVEQDDEESERLGRRALILYERRCKDKRRSWSRADSCAKLGARYFRGPGDERSVKKALRFSRRACREGSAMGCTNLATHHKNGWGTPKSAGLAIRFYRKACDLKEKRKWTDELWGCEDLELLCREHDRPACHR